MSSYYEAIQRFSPVVADESAAERDPGTAESEQPDEVRPAVRVRPANAIVPVPATEATPVTMARAEALQRLAERLAPLAIVERSMRLLLSGCRPADGTSTLASAFALDLSQRLTTGRVQRKEGRSSGAGHGVQAAPVRRLHTRLDGVQDPPGRGIGDRDGAVVPEVEPVAAGIRPRGGRLLATGQHRKSSDRRQESSPQVLHLLRPLHRSAGPGSGGAIGPPLRRGQWRGWRLRAALLGPAVVAALHVVAHSPEPCALLAPIT